MRISVSDLECWRRYKTHEEVELEECLAQLLRKELPSPSMLAGKALHKILETCDYGDEAIVIERDGYSFTFQGSIEVAVPTVREMKGEVEILTAHGPVTLVGIVDGIDSAVIDYKLTGRWDAERLADSYQWRCYLMMFNRNRFDYKVFVGDEKKPSEWVIREYHELSLYRYPGMEQDIQKEVEACAAFMARYVVPAKAA